MKKYITHETMAHDWDCLQRLDLMHVSLALCVSNKRLNWNINLFEKLNLVLCFKFLGFAQLWETMHHTEYTNIFFNACSNDKTLWVSNLNHL